MICDICPHYCDLNEGDVGKCLVRGSVDESIKPLYYGDCSLISVEPIEKRPFFHFLPGTKHLAVGLFGCSFSCKFCANFNVSQTHRGKRKYLPPNDLCDLQLQKGASGIVFTFNEPTVHFEYILDVGVTENRGPISIKTNGFVNSNTLKEIIFVTDAFNVDIKGDELEYKNVCGGWLQPVLESIDTIYESKTHLEISYLVTPRLVSDMSFHRRMLNILKDKPDIPIHILYFYPFYKMSNLRYQVNDLLPVVDIFREHMRYVYISNIYDTQVLNFRNTYCSTCGSLMINRDHDIEVRKLSCCDNFLQGVFSPLAEYK